MNMSTHRLVIDKVSKKPKGNAFVEKTGRNLLFFWRKFNSQVGDRQGVQEAQGQRVRGVQNARGCTEGSQRVCTRQVRLLKGLLVEANIECMYVQRSTASTCTYGRAYVHVAGEATEGVVVVTVWVLCSAVLLLLLGCQWW